VTSYHTIMTISHNSDFITQNCDFITRKLPYFWTALYMSEEICTDGLDDGSWEEEKSVYMFAQAVFTLGLRLNRVPMKKGKTRKGLKWFLPGFNLWSRDECLLTPTQKHLALSRDISLWTTGFRSDFRDKLQRMILSCTLKPQYESF